MPAILPPDAKTKIVAGREVMNPARRSTVATVLFASGHVVIWITRVTVLSFTSNEKADEWCGVSLVNHGLNLPYHAALANTQARERRAPVARVIKKFVRAVQRWRIARRSQGCVVVQLQQSASVFDWQASSVFLAKI